MPRNENIYHILGHMVYIIMYCLMILFSILFYNSVNSVILLYIGWLTLVFGLIIVLYSSQLRQKARIQGNKVVRETFVENGLYSLVRHPEFLGHILIFLALIFIAQHILNLVIGIILIVLLYFAMIDEEKKNIEKFGNTYKDYMHRVPRVNLLIGIIRLIHKKNKDKRDR